MNGSPIAAHGTPNQLPPNVFEVQMRTTTGPFRRAVRLQLVTLPMIARRLLTVLAIVFAIEGAYLYWILNFTETTSMYLSGGATMVCAIYLFVMCIGAITRTLPFALSLGLTRTWTYLGAAAVYSGAALLIGVLMTALSLPEGATDGWGTGLYFFTTPGTLDPTPSGLAALTNGLAGAVGGIVPVVVGLLAGAVYARWQGPGVAALIAIAVAVLLSIGIADSRFRTIEERMAPDDSPVDNIVTLAALVVLSGLIGLAVVRRVRP